VAPLPGVYSVEVTRGGIVATVRSRPAFLQFSSNPQFHFVSKLLADGICGLVPDSLGTGCCGQAPDKGDSKAPGRPRLLASAAGTLSGSLTSGGSTPSSVCKGRTYWTWVTNGWSCSRTVFLTGRVDVASSPISATLAVYDAGSVFVKKCAASTNAAVGLSFPATAGKLYWIAVGYDTMSATGTVSYSIGTACP